jgi:hypothetical protein
MNQRPSINCIVSTDSEFPSVADPECRPPLDDTSLWSPAIGDPCASWLPLDDLSFFLSFNLTSIPGPEDSFDDNYKVDLSKTLLLSRQETKYKAIAFWLAECINSGSKLYGPSLSWSTLDELSLSKFLLL